MALRSQLVAISVALAVCMPPNCMLGAPNGAQSLSTVELVRDAVNNEIKSNAASGQHFMFKDVRKTAHLNQVKLLVETRDATAGMLIAQGGRPLSPEERRQEEARLANYVQNPQELNRKRKQEKEDAEHTMRILKALPDAFLYEPDGVVQGTVSVGHPGHDLVRLKFRPNPSYDPPSRVEQVLTGMEGHLLVDAKEKRIAEINANLTKEVGFGWGILGHLDRGGHFIVQQADVGDQQWEVTRMDLAFTGKILWVKKLNIESTDTFSDFHPVPSDLTFAQGVEMLKKEASEGEASAPQKGRPAGSSARKSREESPEAEAKQLCCVH